MKTIIPMLIFTVVINTILLWITASALTSGIKALSDSCGKEYPIERIVSGDWFCVEELDEKVYRDE